MPHAPGTRTPLLPGWPSPLPQAALAPLPAPPPLFISLRPQPYLWPRKKGPAALHPLHPSDSAPDIQRRVNGPLPSRPRPPPARDSPRPSLTPHLEHTSRWTPSPVPPRRAESLMAST